MIMEKGMYKRDHKLRGSNSACYSCKTNILDFDGNERGRALEAWPSLILHITWKLKVIKYVTKALNHSKMVIILSWPGSVRVTNSLLKSCSYFPILLTTLLQASVTTYVAATFHNWVFLRLVPVTLCDASRFSFKI